MNNDIPDTQQPTPPPSIPSTSGALDDLDFSDVQLSPRQEDATQGIVCEGGCE
ncbi:hypothetical protein [Prosthecobacter sp.]|uniref:hypothetical protein n=1 Tax=Prosthecobacter sp. TaxID=1965333 RepID=UPI003783F65A